MDALPIDPLLPGIVSRLRESRSLVLVAPPGAGKTTRVPPALLRGGLLSSKHPNLVMLQPRRVAARAAAQRIADENGWELGREVGYHVRFDRKLGPQTRLRVLTEGILSRQLLRDPFLDGVGAVLLDEFHERSLHTDVAIAMLREVQQAVRDDLILVVMSATLDAAPVAKFLGNCPIVQAEGRAYPVSIQHVAASSQAPLPERVMEAVEQVLTGSGGDEPGDVLVFLPGVEEIRRTLRRLEPLASERDLLLLPLHGSLSAEEQTRALRPAKQRKVILATNIAETSLTIDGVRTVIDSGLARVAGYDPRRGMDRLELKRISKASATQRAGRAGRTAAGSCLRLWTAREHASLEDFELPEIRRVDLAGTVLSLHAWGKPDPRAFGWFEPPPDHALTAAERFLTMLGALTSESGGGITPLGRQLLTLPVHPRLARLLLGAAEAGAAREGAALAALLSEKDITFAPPGEAFDPSRHLQGPSDLLIRMDLLAEAERSRFAASVRDRGIDPAAARQAARTRDELLRLVRKLPAVRRRPAQDGADLPVDERTLLRLVLLAYPDRVARRRASDPLSAVMVGGAGLRIARESVVRQPEFFVALDARSDERSSTREALVRIASAMEVEWLPELFPQSVRRERMAVFDAQREAVVGRGLTLYRDLVLREDRDAPVDPLDASRVLAEALAPQAAEFFQSDPLAAALLARVNLLRQSMPEHPWPKLDEEELLDVLKEACRGRRSIHEIRGQPLVFAIQTRLPYPLDRLLEQHAPETITVPSGSRIRIAYEANGPPILAVRLQELFGWTDTPRVAAGRVPVLLHLLAPNYRPVQITNDLRSFWSTAYFQVRQDLRTRYPKHSWPQDPLSAKPQAKGRSTA